MPKRRRRPGLFDRLEIPTVLRHAMSIEEPPLGWCERWQALWISFIARVSRGDIFWR